MRLRPRAVTITKVSGAISRLNKESSTVLGASIVWGTTALIFIVNEISDLMPISLISLCALLVTPLAALLIHCLGKLTHRARNSHGFNGTYVYAELYAYITDELRLRGITNAKSYLNAHPEHLQLCLEVGESLHLNMPRPARFDPHYIVESLQALMFSTDDFHDDPQRIKNAIVASVLERKIIDADTIRDMIPAIATTEPALISGAL